MNRHFSDSRKIDPAKAADIHILLVDHSRFKATPAPDGAIVDVRGIWKTMPTTFS